MAEAGEVNKLLAVGLPLTLTIRVSKVSAMVSASFNVH